MTLLGEDHIEEAHDQIEYNLQRAIEKVTFLITHAPHLSVYRLYQLKLMKSLMTSLSRLEASRRSIKHRPGNADK